MHTFQHATISAALVGGGEVWVAKYDDRDIVGAAAWFGPDTGLMHTYEFVPFLLSLFENDHGHGTDLNKAKPVLMLYSGRTLNL